MEFATLQALFTILLQMDLQKEQYKLARFLFHYRNTPRSTTGVSPAELLLKRQPRSHLNIMRPSISLHVQSKQLQQKITNDRHVKNKKLAVDDSVFVCNYATGPTWLPGIIVEERGELTFHVQMEDGRIFRRHIDHIRKRTCSSDNSNIDEGADDFLPDSTPSSSEIVTVPNESTSRCRRSNRIHNPPDRLM